MTSSHATLSRQELLAIQAAVRALLEDVNATQVSVAKRAGLSQQTINKIVNRAEAGVTAYRALRRALNLSEEQFLARYAPSISATIDTDATDIYANLRTAIAKRDWPNEVRAQLAVVRFGDGDQPLAWWLNYGDKLAEEFAAMMARRGTTPPRRPRA